MNDPITIFKVLNEKSVIFEPGSVVAADGLSEELLIKAVHYCKVQHLLCCKCKTSMILYLTSN